MYTKAMRTIQNDIVLVQIPGHSARRFRVSELPRISGFTRNTLVSYPDSGKWAPAYRVLKLPAYEPPMFDSTPLLKIDLNTPLPAFFDYIAHVTPLRRIDRWVKHLLHFQMLLVFGGIAWISYTSFRTPVPPAASAPIPVTEPAPPPASVSTPIKTKASLHQHHKRRRAVHLRKTKRSAKPLRMAAPHLPKQTLSR